MEELFDTEWTDVARLSFERLPLDVQAGFLKELPSLVKKYAELYKKRPLESLSVGTTSHIQVPDWSMWLRLSTEYHEDEDGPILFVFELEELSGKELEDSLQAAQRIPGRINPLTSNGK